jgi:hypothetical protein
MSTIKLFNKALKGKDVDYSTIQELATKSGYLIHPECATQEVYDFLKSQKINFVSTFYQTWEDITSKNRLELFIDQVQHYLSTYGADFESEVYLPERTSKVPDFTNFKVILPIEKDEVITRCEKMLASGIALKQETIDNIFSIFIKVNHIVDVDIIKNKEAKMQICKTLDIFPKENTEFIRYLVYLATEKTLLIKDKETIEAIKNSKLDISKYLTGFGLEELSESFLRFKPIFLAFRDNPNNKEPINRLRRLANKNHKPLQAGYFETLLTDFKGLGLLPEKVKELNNFKKITLLEAINVRLCANDVNVFPIRNGKIWLNKEIRKVGNKETLQLIHSIIYQSLVESLKEKATTIKLPVGLDLKLPKSEKSFVGNYPLGSTFDLSETNAVIGINWKGSEGARDLDLSLTDTKGNKIGWNSSYYNEDKTLIYSGDMTSADPKATELVYASNGFIPSIVKVNLYNGEPNSKFKLFLATEKINNVNKNYMNYMVDPNNILFTIDIEMESKEQSLGIITENKFVISKFRTGNKNVSGQSITNNYIDYTLNTLDTHISLAKVLKDAGFTFVETEAEIDLTNLSKDTLIELLA